MDSALSDTAGDGPIAAKAESLLAAAAAADLIVMPDRRHLGPVYTTIDAQRASFDTATAALDWLEQQLPNVRTAIVAIHRLGLHDIAWQLCKALWPLFLYRRHYDDWVATHLIGVEAAQAGRSPRALFLT
jgi:hypothetical protein